MAPPPRPGRDRVRRRLGEGRGGRRRPAPPAALRRLRAGPSGRRHRAFRAGCRLRRAVPRPLVHPHPAGGRPPRGGGAGRAVLGGARLGGRDHEPGPSRPRAGDHQPRAASHRLQHRRHRRRPGDGDAVRGHQVLGRRLSRFHPHRRLRPDDVARHLPHQQGRGAGDARPLQRGSGAARPGDPLGRRRRLHALFTRTRTIRRGIVAMGQETAEPDFGRRGKEAGRGRGEAGAWGARWMRVLLAPLAARPFGGRKSTAFSSSRGRGEGG